MSGRRRRGRKKPKGAFGRIGFYKMTPVDRTAAIVHCNKHERGSTPSN